MRPNATLTGKQQQLIAALVAGASIVDAAASCTIHKSTAHRWMKEPAFAAALEQARAESFQETLHFLRLGTKNVLSSLLKHVRADVEPTAASQIAADRIWAELAISLFHTTELGKRIDSGSGIAVYIPDKFPLSRTEPSDHDTGND